MVETKKTAVGADKEALLVTCRRIRSKIPHPHSGGAMRKQV